VRATAYLDQGGMNRRQAGEDFYFLQKIIQQGGFTELNETCVYPSPRPSNRVPFGTGQAVRAFLERGTRQTYPWPAFGDLKQLVDQVPPLATRRGFSEEAFTKLLSAPLRDFLLGHSLSDVVAEIRRNTSTAAAFQKRFFRWFDAFRTLKFIHYARDTAYGSQDVVEGARALWQTRVAAQDSTSPIPALITGSEKEGDQPSGEIVAWLRAFRGWDRSAKGISGPPLF